MVEQPFDGTTERHVADRQRRRGGPPVIWGFGLPVWRLAAVVTLGLAGWLVRVAEPDELASAVLVSRHLSASESPVGRARFDAGGAEPPPANAAAAGNRASGHPAPMGDAAEADYDFASRAFPNPVPPGGMVILRMTLTYRPQPSAPPVNATNVRVTDTLPLELVFVAAAPNPDYTCTTPPPGTNGPIACTRLTDITPGTADTFEVVARATGCWSGPVEVVTTVSFDTVSAPSVTWTLRTPPPGLLVRCSPDAASAPTPTAAPVGPPGNLTVITPVRVVDTRPTGGRTIHTGFQPDGQPIPVAPIPAGNPAHPDPTVRRFLVAGRTFGGTAIPAGVTGLLINVAAIRSDGGDGYVVVFGGGVSAPSVSTLNPARPLTSNFWATRVAPPGGPYLGTIAVFSTETLDLTIDVVGYTQ